MDDRVMEEHGALGEVLPVGLFFPFHSLPFSQYASDFFLTLSVLRFFPAKGGRFSFDVHRHRPYLSLRRSGTPDLGVYDPLMIRGRGGFQTRRSTREGKARRGVFLVFKEVKRKAGARGEESDTLPVVRRLISVDRWLGSDRKRSFG
jgi:hypothetical protein